MYVDIINFIDSGEEMEKRKEQKMKQDRKDRE